MNIHIPHGGSHVPFGPKPVHTRCPACNADIVTTVKSQPNTQTHFIALLLCVILAWCCVWIPYYKDSCQNRNHFCPNCEAYLGTYRP